MIMILFGALSSGTKTYLLCRSDRHAFRSTFSKTLPVGCLKFCFFEIQCDVSVTRICATFCRGLPEIDM